MGETGIAASNDREDWVGPLDGVRGLAALWVLFAHTAKLCGSDWFYREHLAVEVFMLVSGFLMAHHYMKRRVPEPWGNPTTWLHFWIRRFFRIAPLYYVVLVPSMIFASRFGEWRSLIAEVSGRNARQFLPPTPDNWIAHISFAFGFFPRYHASTVPPDWSIGLEAQFYLAFPFLMLLLARYSSIAIVAVSVLIATASERAFASYFVFPTVLPLRLDIFVAGILMAMTYNERVNRSLATLYLVLAMWACLMGSGAELATIGSALAILVLAQGGQGKDLRVIGFARSLFGSRAASWLADMSYGIYLVHLLVIYPLVGHLCTIPRFVALPSFLRCVIVVPLVVIASYMIAAILHRFIEQPGIAVGKRLIRKRRPLAAMEVQ